MNQFKANASIWISKHSGHDAVTLQSVGDIRSLTVTDDDVNLAGAGYTRVGHADIIVTIATTDQIIGCKVASLRAELEKDRADSQMRQNGLIDQINKMEALSYEPSAS